MNFFKDGLSIDETKFSVLVFLLVLCTGYALFSDGVNERVSVEIIELIKIFIYSVAGINITEKITDTIKSKKSVEIVEELPNQNSDM
jgi:hypothetical protein